MKNSQQQENQLNTMKSPKQSSNSPEKGNLEKIEETAEEERESYYYSNSEDDHSSKLNLGNITKFLFLSEKTK